MSMLISIFIYVITCFAILVNTLYTINIDIGINCTIGMNIHAGNIVNTAVVFHSDSKTIMLI